MTCYCSVNEALSILGTAQQGNLPSTIDPSLLLSNVRIVSTEIDNKFPPVTPPRWPAFAPYLGTRKLRVDGQNVNSIENTYQFNTPLLRLDGVVLNSQSYTVGTQVQAFPDSSYPPFYQINWVDWCMPFWYGCCTWPIFINVTGVWGFNRDFANAWLAVDALAAAITTTTQTTFTVSSVSGADDYGAPYRISPGHLLQIDSEWMDVLSVQASSNTVTVKRAVNGSTAATHLINATVSRWQVEEPVKRATARQADLMWARMGAYTTMEVQGMGTEVRYPNHWLAEVDAMLAGYQYG